MLAVPPSLGSRREAIVYQPPLNGGCLIDARNEDTRTDSQFTTDFFHNGLRQKLFYPH